MPTVSGSPTKPPHKVGKLASGVVASAATWVMTADSATMTGFVYQGNVNMPVAGGGTVTMMEFTVGSMDMSGTTTTITEGGRTATEADAGFTASGVTMYATQMSGSILGIPVTFTPSTVSEVLLGLTNLISGVVPITMTGVTADQTIILASQAQKTSVSAAS